jgi:GMP synthase (glutamine-hydrolysing)
MTLRQALVLSHVTFEDLGSLEQPLLDRGFEIENINVAMGEFPALQAQQADLLVVMGGPIGVYDQQDYPFLVDEITSIRQRLTAGRPTLGICLGAQ